jgi:hypothetical protein
VCIAPVALWGPIVLSLAYAYYVRRRPAAVSDSREPHDPMAVL